MEKQFTFINTVGLVDTMRIWSLHPKYLDSLGLVALWREALLAQAVLSGKTNGYRNHPQLARFRHLNSPVGAIADYLHGVHAESLARGYQFSAAKISSAYAFSKITVTRGQLRYEWDHLMSKLQTRNSERNIQLETVKRPRPHPLFRVIPGGVEEWERVADVAQQKH